MQHAHWASSIAQSPLLSQMLLGLHANNGQCNVCLPIARENAEACRTDGIALYLTFYSDLTHMHKVVFAAFLQIELYNCYN